MRDWVCTLETFAGFSADDSRYNPSLTTGSSSRAAAATRAVITVFLYWDSATERCVVCIFFHISSLNFDELVDCLSSDECEQCWRRKTQYLPTLDCIQVTLIHLSFWHAGFCLFDIRIILCSYSIITDWFRFLPSRFWFWVAFLPHQVLSDGLPTSASTGESPLDSKDIKSLVYLWLRRVDPVCSSCSRWCSSGMLPVFFL